MPSDRSNKDLPTGYALAAGTEDSFPYQPTTDQPKAVQDVKRDMESRSPDGSPGVW